MRGQVCRRQKKCSHRSGSAAIEFAMLALPFFLFLLAILEIGALLLLDAIVETAAADASRQIRTGQAQLQNLTPQAIKNRFCSNMSVFSGDCQERAFIDIQTVTSYTAPVVPDPFKDGIFDESKLGYNPGIPGDFVMVRIWYEHTIATPFIAEALTRTSDKRVLLNTSLAFRNEPYL